MLQRTLLFFLCYWTLNSRDVLQCSSRRIALTLSIMGAWKGAYSLLGWAYECLSLPERDYDKQLFLLVQLIYCANVHVYVIMMMFHLQNCYDWWWHDRYGSISPCCEYHYIILEIFIGKIFRMTHSFTWKFSCTHWLVIYSAGSFLWTWPMLKKYLRPIDGLPDSRKFLSASIRIHTSFMYSA